LYSTLFISRQGATSIDAAPAPRSQDETAAPAIRSTAGASQSRTCPERLGLQHELAVTRSEEFEHLGVAVAGFEPLTHQDAQVARKRRIQSSMDWFWQTMQRNSRESTRARASRVASESISSGCTAPAGYEAANTSSRAKQ
jgi:hypothetical protein